jgi:hypothetical protein
MAAASGKKKIAAPPPPLPLSPPHQSLPPSSDSRLDANPLPDRSPSGAGIKPKSLTPTSQGPSPASPGTWLFVYTKNLFLIQPKGVRILMTLDFFNLSNLSYVLANSGDT